MVRLEKADHVDEQVHDNAEVNLGSLPIGNATKVMN
jgi:hypothetical protein